MAPAYLSLVWDPAVVNEILTEISKITPLNHDDLLRLESANFQYGYEQYADRHAKMQRQKDLVAAKEALLDAVEKVEQCEKATEKNVTDRMERKRLAEDALDKQLEVLEGLRKRLKRDSIKVEEDKDEDEGESQELGTMTL